MDKYQNNREVNMLLEMALSKLKAIDNLKRLNASHERVFHLSDSQFQQIIEILQNVNSDLDCVRNIIY